MVMFLLALNFLKKYKQKVFHHKKKMINGEKNQFLQWEDDLLDSIKSFSPSNQMLTDFQKNISDILTTKKLHSTNEEYTNSFIENFCPKLILFILHSHPPIDKAPILNSFLYVMIPLYSELLINSENELDFIKTAKLIIFDSKKQFYRSTVKSSNEGSPFYEKNIQKFVDSQVLENATNFLNENEDVNISKILLFISNFHPFHNLFNEKSLLNFYSIASLRLQKNIHKIEEEDIRSINEKEIQQAVFYIHQVLSSESTFSESLEKLNSEMFHLSIKFVKSPFLNKQYSGLSTIRNQLVNLEKSENNQRSKKGENDIENDDTENDLQFQLCKILDDEQIVPILLRSLHHGLVCDFLAVFKIMIKNGFINDNDLQEFWNLVLKQHQTTIDVFLYSIEDLMNFLNEKMAEQMWVFFSKSDKFPIQVLLFFQRIANKGSESNRIVLYESLNSYYKKIENKKSSEKVVLIETMCILLPENKTKCDEIRRKSFKMMNKKKNVDYDFSLSLLKASCKSMTPKSAHESFHELLEIIKGIQNVSIIKFLDPLQQMIIHIDDPITDDEFDELIKITTLHIISNQNELIEFYRKIFQKNVNNIKLNDSNNSIKTKTIDSNNNDNDDDDDESIEEIKDDDKDSEGSEKVKKTKKKKKKIKRKSSASGSANKSNNNNTTNHCFLNNDKILIILQKTSEIDPPPIDFIIFLFEEINKYQFKKSSSSSLINDLNSQNENEKIVKSAESLSGIDLLWNINFKYDEIIEISSYLCNLYSKSENTTIDIKKYLKRCLNNTEKISSFITIRLMMDNLEWTFDKLSRNIEENKFYTKFDCYEINIIGFSSETVLIPKLLQFDGFYERVAYLLDLKRKDISIYFVPDPTSIMTQNRDKNSEKIYFYDKKNDENEIYINSKDAIFITHDNYMTLIKDNITIGVNVLNGLSKSSTNSKSFRVSFSKEYSTSYFPSLYLSKPKHFTVIFNFVRHNRNNKIARIALDIVNRLPTSEKELNAIRSDTEKKPNWTNLFSLKNNHWCIFLYRLNIVGSLLLKGGEWIDSFYMSGGSLWLSNILFTDALTYFTSNEDLQLILEVATLLLKNIESKKLKKKMINSLGKEAIEKVVVLSIQHKNSPRMLKSLFEIIFEFAEVLPTAFINFKPFIHLFNFSIFNKNQIVRESIEKVVNILSPLKFENPIIHQLQRSNNPYCDEYFSILNEVAQAASDELLNMMVDTLYNKYKMDDKVKLIDQLCFSPPNEKFTHGFFKVFDLVILTKTIAKLNKNDVFSFIVENILFNKFKYYNPSQNLFNILSYFLKRDQNLANLIISKAVMENKDMGKLAPVGSFSFVKNRGIKNLGATCYMNATIQALYSIHYFRYLILKKYTKNEIERMKDHLLNEIEDNDDDEEEETENDSNQKINRKSSNSKSSTENNNNNNDVDEDESQFEFPDWFKKFQFIFAKLLLYPTNYIDISDFVKSFKWYNEPVNFHAQQDAVEFIQMLLDRLSEQLPIVTELFQGEICHETVGTNVDFVHQNREKFVIFPLEVNGNSSVEESFQSFLMPDIFEGHDQYAAEEIGKIDAKRFHWVSRAPKVLILQLKRFSYNIKTGRREKLNSEFSFPFELNLKTIMKSSKKQEFDKNSVEDNDNEVENDCFYDLVAVEMHSGDAAGGHFFSYCGPPCTSRKNMKEWIKFDDTKTEKVNSRKILDFAKGGDKLNEDNRNQSAYLLFYLKRTKNLQEQISIEKVDVNRKSSSLLENENKEEGEIKSDDESTENIKLNSVSENSIVSSNTNSSLMIAESSIAALNKDNKPIKKTISSTANNLSVEEEEDENDDEFDDQQIGPIHHEIDDELIQKVAKEVENLVKFSVIKNPDYSHFLMSIASTSNDINFVYEFLMSSLKNTKDKTEIISIFSKMREIMNNKISTHFLNEKTFIYNNYLVANEDREIRKICSDVVISAINHSNGQFNSYLEFIENYLPRSISNWPRFDEFLLPLVYIIEKKSNRIDKKKWATILIDFLGKTLPNSQNIQIFLLIKLDSIYKCLNILFSDEDSSLIRNEFESTIFSIEFLKPLLISRRNSKNLANLIHDFIASPSNSKDENELKRSLFFTSINNFVFEEKEQMIVICGVFSTFLFFDKSSIVKGTSPANNEKEAINNNQENADNNNEEEEDDDKDDDEYEMSNFDDLSEVTDFGFSIDKEVANENEVVNNVLIVLKASTSEDNEQFLCELILRIPYIQNKLIPFLSHYTNFWIIHWLFNVELKTRNDCCELLYKVFNDFPRLTFIDDNNGIEKEIEDEVEIYDEKSQKINHQAYERQSLKLIATSMYSMTKKFVEYCNSRLKNSYQLHLRGIDTFRMLPYRHFYELLRWSIVRTDSASIILKKPKLLVNGMVKFKKIEKVNSDLCFATLKFIHSVIGIKHSKKFFKKRRFARKFVKVFSNATFDSINRYTSIETVSMIITLLPHRYSKYLFETKFFKNSIEYCFSAISVTAPQLENYIIANAKLKKFAPLFWSDSIFNRNYKDSNYYLSLTTNLLTLKPKLSNLFFDLGRPKQIMKSIVVIGSSSSSNNIINPSNDDNKNESRNSIKFFKNKKSDKNIKLSEKVEKFVEEFTSVSAKQIEVLVAFLRAYQQYGKKPRSLLNQMIGLKGEIERMLYISLINDGNDVRTDVLLAIYKILMQLFVMGSEFEQTVLNYVRNGLLGSAREDVWSGAIELIRFICVILNANQKESTAYNLALKELSSLKKPYNFRIVVELCDIITTPLFLYEPPVDGIVDFLNRIRIDGEMPEPVPKEIKKLILTLRDKEAKGISNLLELIGAQY